MNRIQDLVGKTMVITGATSGIGYATASTLAGRGASIIGIGHTEERCRAAERAIHTLYSDAKVSFQAADLSSQRQIRQLAANIRAKTPRINVLVNNAGTVSSWYMATEDGYELQLAVNHLAAFLLTQELLPLLEATPAGSVITVSSGAHVFGKIHWDDVMNRRHYRILRVYNQSKLANVLFTLEFNRRHTGHVRAYAADSGLVNTEIGLKGTGQLEQWVWKIRRAGGFTPEKGAATIIHLATALQLEPSDSPYWKDCRPAKPGENTRSPEDAAKLWALSERLCGIQG